MGVLAIALVGGLVGGGLFAYFSDTEVSVGNTFTAGNTDLALDVDWFEDGQEFNPWPGSPLINPDMTSDIKPGMEGTDLISLHIYSFGGNDKADLYIYLDTLVDEENGRSNREALAGDASDIDGELPDFLWLQLWHDDGADGIPQSGDPGEGDKEMGPGEVLIWSGYARDLFALQDGNGGVLLAGPIEMTHCEVYYVGAKWLFSSAGNGSWIDDDIAQSDRFGCDIIFKPVQNGAPPPCPP